MLDNDLALELINSAFFHTRVSELEQIALILDEDPDFAEEI
jgi:hypothetical protein